MNTKFYSRSATIACCRLRGSHTFDVLAGALEDIHTEYAIRQVTRTTTDNGSNFVKAFSVFDVSPTTTEDD